MQYVRGCFSNEIVPSLSQNYLNQVARSAWCLASCRTVLFVCGVFYFGEFVRRDTAIRRNPTSTAPGRPQHLINNYYPNNECISAVVLPIRTTRVLGYRKTFVGQLWSVPGKTPTRITELNSAIVFVLSSAVTCPTVVYLSALISPSPVRLFPRARVSAFSWSAKGVLSQLLFCRAQTWPFVRF